MNATATRLEAPEVRSLLWQGDTLFDYLGGFAYDLGGQRQSLNTSWAHRFDGVVASPSGRFVALYERLGTEGILLCEGAFLRALSRRRHDASGYEHPICLFALPDGREVIAHCPDEYHKLEIEVAETGKRLTQRSNEPEDFFHSRLAANPQGNRLLSAGWVWHPFDAVACIDLEAALHHPQLMDAPYLWEKTSDVSNAAWLSENLAVLYSHQGANDFHENKSLPAPRLSPGTLAVYDVQTDSYISSVSPALPVGTMHALDANHVLGLYQYPKIVRLSDGAVIQAWPHLKTGTQISSIVYGPNASLPPMAFDARNLRFAVADEASITVLRFDLSDF